jgi:hypothetical protein
MRKSAGLVAMSSRLASEQARSVVLSKALLSARTRRSVPSPGDHRDLQGTLFGDGRLPLAQ